MTYEEFGKLLPKLPCNDYLVWIKLKYKHEKEYDYIVEYLSYEGDYNCYAWEYDWHEGQEDVEVLDYMALYELNIDRINTIRAIQNQDRINHIARWLKENVYRNPDVMYSDCDINKDLSLIDVCTALFEELYYLYTGEHYDYMWHWANKVGTWAITYKFSNEGNRIVEVKKHEEN